MEVSTTSAMDASTGSNTIADLLSLAADRYGDHVAARHKQDGTWHDVTYADVREVADEIALGLIGLGIAPGDRVSILCRTRHEWTSCDFGATQAGAVVVPIYPTNSPEECEWVARDSDARAIFCEDAAQVAKIAEVRARLPHLEHVIVIDPSGDGDLGDAITLGALRARGRGEDRAELERRIAGVKPTDPFTFIYTSGTTGPPKGCVLTHGNYRAMLTMAQSARTVGENEVTYLYLPLAHSYALLIQLLSFDVGATIAYWSNDPQQIVVELNEVHPTNFPSVPRIFEKIYTLVTSNADPEMVKGAVAVGMRVRELEVAGTPIPEELQASFAKAEEALFSNVRNAFGGRVRQAVSGAAPIAKRDPRVLLCLWRAGVRGLRDDGDVDRCDLPDARAPQVRHGRARLPRRRAEDRRGRRGLDQGREHLRRLPQQRGRELRCGRRRLAAHGRPRLARRGRLPDDHRPQEGHHHHRRRQEPHARQHRERHEAVPLGLAGRHARRPPPLPGHARDARRRGDRPVGPAAGPADRDPRACGAPRRACADPGSPRRRQRQVRPGREGQEASRSSTTTCRRRRAS